MITDKNYDSYLYLRFICFECKYTFIFEGSDDPTTSTGCCRNCGSHKWQIRDLSGNIVE